MRRLPCDMERIPLVDFLETNPRLLSIISTFNFQGSLDDDILAARANLDMGGSPSP